ncbi:MAG: hypothetical protein GF329_00365 [Candidatus Lokiarchaeota archaeon]|nr:hypothetical protein [Candidatus Lokiarchaeota archaeon]
MNDEIQDLSKEELIEIIVDSSKLWLAHDGLWFQAVEKNFDIETAMKLDAEAWRRFTVIEAKRIMKRLDMKPGGGIPNLIRALKYRLYAYINVQEVVDVTETSCVFRMNDCRVQSARKRKGLQDFPCKSVGIVEYSYFAKTIDPRIKTECVACPPDPHPENFYCSWRFYIED